MQHLREMQMNVSGKGWVTGDQFQLHLYYQMDRNSDNSTKLTLTLRYYCWNLYLGPVNFEISGDISYSGSTNRISDSNASSRHYGDMWSGSFTLSEGESYTFELTCNYFRGLEYSDYIYNGFRSNSITLTAPKYTQTLSTPSAPTVTPSGGAQRNTPVTVKWNKVDGASGYYLQYKKGNGSWINYGSYNSASTSASLYLRNLSGYSIGSVFYFRVKALGDGGNDYYDSSYSSQSSGVTALNTPATISSLSVNKTYFTSGIDYPTLTYSGSDPDGQTIKFDILRNGAEIVSESTLLTYTDDNLSPGTYNYLVRISDNTGSSKALTIYKNSIPTISIGALQFEEGQVIIPITVTRGSAAEIRQSSGTLTVKLFSDSSSSPTTEKKTFTYQINNSEFESSSYTYNLLIDYNESSNEYLPYINIGDYFLIKCSFNDSIEDSIEKESTSTQRPTVPNYACVFTNIPLTGQGVEVPLYDIVKGENGENIYFDFRNDPANGELAGRRRNYKALHQKAKIQFSCQLNPGDSISKIQILKSSSDSSSVESFVSLRNEIELVNGSFSDINCNISTTNSVLSGYFIDNEINSDSQLQYYVKYRIVLVNSNGISSTTPSDTVQFITNTPPYFPSSNVTLSKTLLKITPNTNTTNFEGITVAFPLSNSSYGIKGSENDEVVIINNSNSDTCDKYEIELRFQSNIITGSDGVDTNIYKIKDIFLHNESPTDPNSFIKDLLFVDGASTGEYIGFNNVQAIHKINSYSSVELRIYSYDTFGVRSSNYLSRTISIDFTDNPIFDSSTFSISDATNNDLDLIPLKNREMPRLMNPGESLDFSFPPAQSVRNVQAGLGRGISEYQILYSTDGQIYNLLKNLKVGIDLEEKPITDETNYTYSHEIRNYNKNTDIYFKIIAIDVGQNGASKLSSDEIFSDLPKTSGNESYSDIMVCRKAIPIIQIDKLNFIGSEPSTNNQIELGYSINDIGGSYITSPNDYFIYKNFERNIFSPTTTTKKGQFLKVQIAFSETPSNFVFDDSTILNIVGAPYFGNSISFPTNYLYNNLYLDANKTYYAKLRIRVGTNTKAADTIGSIFGGRTLEAESQIYVLRSLRPTFSIRDKKIGINIKEPQHSLHVSAGDSSENKYVQFDSGLSDDNIIKFDLSNGHMIRGIIDCGRLV